MFIQLQNSGNIPTPITIIRSRPNSHQSISKHLFIPFHHKLMSPSNQFYTIFMIPFRNNITSKQIPSTSRTKTPSLYIFRIRPHQITHRPLMRDFLLPINSPHRIYIRQFRRKPTMYTENPRINNSSKR